MNRGYVRTWRKVLDSGWLKNHKLWAFWSWCLLKATHKEFDAIVGLQVVHLMPGQFIFGRTKAAQETGLTEREIRTIIDCLKKCGNMTIKTTNKYSIITIVNWTTYQSEAIENDQLNDQPLTNKGPHTKTKEHKNINISPETAEVLSYLNEKTGKRYRITNHISARLKDGATAEDCKRVIDAKILDPYFIANPKYLNPETLFRLSNFDKYLNESPTTVPDQNKASAQDSTCPRCRAQVPPQDRIDQGCIHCEGKVQVSA